MDIYIDAEFDAVYHDNHFIQCVISVGLIAAENDKVIDTFYTLVRPHRFRKLTHVVKRITKLSNDDIRKAPCFQEVMNKMHAFIRCYQKQDCIYSFGPDDIRTIKNQAVYEHYENDHQFQNVIDLQRVISHEIKHNGELLSPALSLDDLKYLYGIDNKVEHNALSDAFDLFCIHKAYQKKKIQKDRVCMLSARKKQKQQEAKRRSQERMQKHLLERCSQYEYQSTTTVLNDDINSLIQCLCKRGFLHLFADFLTLLNDNSHPKGSFTMQWQMHPQPAVYVSITLPNQSHRQLCPLTYANVGIFERILKLTEDKKQK